MIRPRPLALLIVAAVALGCGGGGGSPSTAPAATASPAGPSFDNEPTLEPPPLAVLVVPGGRHPGKLGSYIWNRAGDDAPWFPVTALEPIAVAARQSARVELEAPVPIAAWTARAATAADTVGKIRSGLGEGAGPPVFELPAGGAWVVAVELQFAAGAGDATWYWSIVVN
jgi:hypothetical protein